MEEILRNMLRRKLRSALTIVGIVIGVFALTVLGAMAEKMNYTVGLGLSYLSGQITVLGKGLVGSSTGIITRTQIEQIREIPGISSVQPQAYIPLDDNSSSSGLAIGPAKLIVGLDLSIEYPNRNFKLPLARGRMLSAGERGKAMVGAEIAFQRGLELGSTMDIKGTQFEVVGIVERMLTIPDNMIFMPIEDARDILFKVSPMVKAIFDYTQVLQRIPVIGQSLPALSDFDPKHLATELAVGWTDGTDPDVLAEQIKETIPDVRVLGPKETREYLERATVVFNLIIFASALIALLVGGLSVINTMMTSISERTKEIGLKKAIGANTWDILNEYLFEAGIIGLLGGVLGVTAGILAVGLLNNYTTGTGVAIFMVTPRLALGAVTFAAMLGIAAGIYPALRAAALDPVKAFREE